MTTTCWFKWAALRPTISLGKIYSALKNTKSTDLTKLFTLEGFLLLSIFCLTGRTTQRWTDAAGCCLHPPQQASPVFKIQKKDNFHLLALFADKACAAVVISRCGQVGKGTQVFAFRVVPRTERGWWWWQLWFEHLSTFPWGSLLPWAPPIVRKPSSQTSAHVFQPLFWRVNGDPP